MNVRLDQSPADILARKDHHLDLCLDDKVESRRWRGAFDRYHFEHQGLPELDYAAIDTSCTLLGRELNAPFVIGAMTGGTPRALRINRILSQAAQDCGVGMALGSQRALLERPESLQSFRSDARPPLRIGNLGAVQLNYGVGLDAVQGLIDGCELDALALHLNPLQEAIQPGGDTDFSGLVRKLSELIPKLSVPVIVKEVGAGISQATARRIVETGAAAIEVAGVGGTSWAAVEGFRGGDDNRRAGEVFRAFGIPTPRSLQACALAAPQLQLVASGGLRTGLDGAKAIALGADAFAMARPLLVACEGEGDDASTDEAALQRVTALLHALIRELRIAMFCTGSANLGDLREQPLWTDGAHFDAPSSHQQPRT